jgi:hypothetical protein
MSENLRCNFLFFNLNNAGNLSYHQNCKQPISATKTNATISVQFLSAIIVLLDKKYFVVKKKTTINYDFTHVDMKQFNSQLLVKEI